MGAGTACRESEDDEGDDAPRSGETRNAALLGAHRRSIAARINRRVRDDADRADLLQEVSLVVLRSRIEFTDARHFESWCTGVIDHTVSRWQRSHVRRKRWELAASEAASIGLVVVDDPERRTANMELVARAFAAVDLQSFTLLVARYVDCWTAEELSRAGAENPAAIRMRLSRLRDAARRALDASVPSACSSEAYSSVPGNADEARLLSGRGVRTPG